MITLIIIMITMIIILMVWMQADQKMGATTGKEGEAKMGPGEVKRIIIT